MNIAITPRIGNNTRRDHERLQAEINLLLTIPRDGTGCSLGESPARGALQVAGLIQSYRPSTGRRSLWQLTETGKARVAALSTRVARHG